MLPPNYRIDLMSISKYEASPQQSATKPRDLSFGAIKEGKKALSALRCGALAAWRRQEYKKNNKEMVVSACLGQHGIW